MPAAIIPAQAGIQYSRRFMQNALDFRLRGNNGGGRFS